jgi:hypothetical protein
MGIEFTHGENQDKAVRCRIASIDPRQAIKQLDQRELAMNNQHMSPGQRRRFLKTVGGLAGFATLPLSYSSRVFAAEHLGLSLG